MKPRTKLELTWIGKENRPKLEPRILLEDPGKSYHAPHRVGENDIFDNRLIFGDNLHPGAPFVVRSAFRVFTLRSLGEGGPRSALTRLLPEFGGHASTAGLGREA